MCWKVRKIRDRYFRIFDAGANFTKFLMRPAQEIVEYSKLVDQFERGRMNRVPSKIAQKILVLFEHRYFDTRTGEKKTQHHTGRACAHDAASGLHGLGNGISRGHGRVLIPIISKCRM